MMNTYRALSVAAKSQYGEEPVELDLSVVDEKDALDGGHLELVPRKYKVLSNNFSGGPEGGEYVGALLKENEAALIAGGHIERVDAKPVEDALPPDEPPADAPAVKKASK
jgi:hypothetical protein